MAKISMGNYGDLWGLLEAVKEEICDNYCKWPEKYSFDGTTYQSDEEFDRLQDERCEDCPLDLL